MYLSRWWIYVYQSDKDGECIVSIKVIQTWIVFIKVMKMFYQSDKDGKCIISVKVMQMWNVFLVYFCPIRPTAGFHSSSKAGGDVFVLPAAGTNLWSDTGKISLWRLDSGGERAWGRVHRYAPCNALVLGECTWTYTKCYTRHLSNYLNVHCVKH